MRINAGGTASEQYNNVMHDSRPSKIAIAPAPRSRALTRCSEEQPNGFSMARWKGFSNS
jgi:hypothetical protein